MSDPFRILLDVLAEHVDADKWVDSSFEHIKRISNTHVGSVGQAFIERLCEDIGFKTEYPVGQGGVRSKTSPWDLKIEEVSFEIKTATEDTNRSFQFNHIRHHREYQALLCVGIGPEYILFDAWSKADVSTGNAGHLVTMDKGSSATWKLTKRQSQLQDISTFKDSILNLLSEIAP